MVKTTTDPVFGELNQDGECRSCKINFSFPGKKDKKIDLLVSCKDHEEILGTQRDAYAFYMSKFDSVAQSFPKTLLEYYKSHYEDFDRKVALLDVAKIDVITENIALKMMRFDALFIDRNGQYGWLGIFVGEENPISVILSDEKVKIYEGWDVLKENYTKINDEAFGEMVYDYSWKKSVKMDLYGVKGRWIDVVASADSGEGINEAQRTAYRAYLEKAENFMDEIPNAVIAYYLENYEDIEEWNNVPDKYNKQKVTKDSVMELLNFKTLYFDEEGRYGWLCGCTWDSAGLAIVLSNDKVEVTVQDELIG